MWLTISNHSSLLHSSPWHWSCHLPRWWGWLVQQDLLAGCRAGSQKAAGLTSSSSSFSVKNTTSFSHKNRATVQQRSHPNHSTALARRYITSFETTCVCIWRMSGVTYRNLRKYLPVLSESQAQNSNQSDRLTAQYQLSTAKKPFCCSKG